MGAGGPHAAFFAVKDEYKRNIPGRLIGVSKDMDDNMALRMALQTREQHIKRDKATSNICTAQALLAVMASMYAVYHGPAGMREIALHVHSLAAKTADGLKAMGIETGSKNYFDTVWVKGIQSSAIQSVAEEHKMNFHYVNDHELTISFGEPHTTKDVETILSIFAKIQAKSTPSVSTELHTNLEGAFLRSDKVFTHATFNSYHSESKMMRYLKRLENKDISLVHSMIPLGSCTMKLNAASELMPITNPQFANIPIIAMTAHALTEIRDRCLAEGMQDYLTKPIHPETLFQTLMNWIPKEHGQPSESPTLQKAAATGKPLPLIGIDSNVGLSHMAGNLRLYTQLLERFCQSQRNAIHQLHQQIEQQQWQDAIRQAHTLRGLASNIGAQKLALAAQEVEQECQNEQAGSQLNKALEQLENELHTVLNSLDNYFSGGTDQNAGQLVSAPDPDAPEKMRHLCALLEDNNIDAEDYLLQIKASLTFILPENTIKRLASHISQYEFDLARELLP